MAELLNQKVFLILLIITIGVAIGRIKIAGFNLGIAAIMFVGLVFGHFGYRVDGDFTNLGLLLFVFTIGLQSGPGFINSFRKNGKRLLSLAVVLVFSASFIAWISSWLFNFDIVVAIGLYAGAMGSTPGLAAGLEATGSPDVAIGYGIAYPFGVIGFSFLIKLFPKIFKINLKKSEKEYLEEIEKQYPTIVSRLICVNNEFYLDRPLSELNLQVDFECTVTGVFHNKKFRMPGKDTVIRRNDMVKVSGTKEHIDKLVDEVGEFVAKKKSEPDNYVVKWVLVTNKMVTNKFYREIDLPYNYSATVSKIKRSGIEISPNHNSIFRFGDKLQIVAPKKRIKEISQLLGNDNKMLSAINIIPIFLGITLGYLLGTIKIPMFGGMNFSLGITGGAIIAGLVLSAIGKTGPVVWSMSGSSNQLLREVGLAIFLAGIGTKTGVSFVQTLQNNGATLFLIGAVITIVPAIITMFVGHKIFKMNFLTLIGATTGILTNSAGMGLLNGFTKTNACSIAYAMVFPFAMILIIIFSQLLAMFA
jgi:putative transport protein